jgi:hypothetical protein
MLAHAAGSLLFLSLITARLILAAGEIHHSRLTPIKFLTPLTPPAPSEPR